VNPELCVPSYVTASISLAVKVNYRRLYVRSVTHIDFTHAAASEGGSAGRTGGKNITAFVANNDDRGQGFVSTHRLPTTATHAQAIQCPSARGQM